MVARQDDGCCTHGSTVGYEDRLDFVNDFRGDCLTMTVIEEFAEIEKLDVLNLQILAFLIDRIT